MAEAHRCDQCCFKLFSLRPVDEGLRLENIMEVNRPVRIVVLRNELEGDHLGWVNALEMCNVAVDYSLINLTQFDWLERIIQFKPDICLLKPSGNVSLFRTLYQERVEIIERDLKIEVFPSYNELRIYENKRYFSYWLKAQDLPHPKTCVFYHKEEALAFGVSCRLPIVAKINIGASGSGVRIIRDRKSFTSYVDLAFGRGLTTKTGPNFKKAGKIRRLLRKLTHPRELFERINYYKAVSNDKQRGFVIFQDYIEHDFEWRVVRIGDSYFAHKKLKVGDMASGTLLKNYDNPPLDLLDFVKGLTDEHGFRSVAVDLFATSEQGYLVNEIQCIFGQSDGFQMKVDGVIGRYRNAEGIWVFDPGDYARNACYDLRLEYIIDKISHEDHAE